MKLDIKIAIGCIVILIIATVILNNGIDWLEFGEIIILLILLFWIAGIKIPIEIPGFIKIGEELGEIKRNLSVVAKNISNVRVTQKVTNVTPTSYEGPPIELLEGMMTTTATVDSPTEEINTNKEE